MNTSMKMDFPQDIHSAPSTTTTIQWSEAFAESFDRISVRKSVSLLVEESFLISCIFDECIELEKEKKKEKRRQQRNASLFRRYDVLIGWLVGWLKDVKIKFSIHNQMKTIALVFTSIDLDAKSVPFEIN